MLYRIVLLVSRVIVTCLMFSLILIVVLDLIMGFTVGWSSSFKLGYGLPQFLFVWLMMAALPLAVVTTPHRSVSELSRPAQLVMLIQAMLLLALGIASLDYTVRSAIRGDMLVFLEIPAVFRDAALPIGFFIAALILAHRGLTGLKRL